LLDNLVTQVYNKVERRKKMNKKKIKRINVRVNLKDYLILKGNYLSNKKKFKTFSSYLRHLLDLGLNNDH